MSCNDSVSFLGSSPAAKNRLTPSVTLSKAGRNSSTFSLVLSTLFPALSIISGISDQRSNCSCVIPNPLPFDSSHSPDLRNSKASFPLVDISINSFRVLSFMSPKRAIMALAVLPLFISRSESCLSHSFSSINFSPSVSANAIFCPYSAASAIFLS